MNTQDLILKVESSVIATNIAEFKLQAETYVNGLTSTFKTDDDFSAAENDVKSLKDKEEKVRSAINEVANGSKDVAEIIETANEVAELLRAARLDREKIVKAEKENRKQAIVDVPISELNQTYSQPSPILAALKETLPLAELEARISNAIKGRQKLDKMQAAVNTEFSLIKAELFDTVNKLNQRYELFPSESAHLFRDIDMLLASDKDIIALQVLINERLNAEKARIDSKKAQAFAADQARIEAEKHAETEQAAAVAQIAEVITKAPNQENTASEQQVRDESKITDVYTIKLIDSTKGNAKMHVYGDLETVKEIARCFRGNFETISFVQGEF